MKQQNKIVEFMNKIKNKKLISIKNKKFFVVGFKETIIPETGEKPLKFRLKDETGNFFWLEFQFEPQDTIVLWKKINFYPIRPFPQILKYKNKNFKLIEKGISNIKIATGAAKSFKNEKVHWWEYKFNGEMLSLGWLENAKKWENLLGYIINTKDITYST